MPCQVCYYPDAETHFGGICCRACAAFFRRYHFSKKKYVFCTCQGRKNSANSHPCRQCRIEKCRAIGMSEKKIQPMRDKGSSTLSYPPPLSLLHCQIIPRDSPHMSSTISFWPNYEQKRNELYGGRFDELNIYDLSSYAKRDSELMWQVVSFVFPQVMVLEDGDKTALLGNFVPKWWQLEPAIDFEKNQKLWKENGRSVNTAIIDFYSGDKGTDSQEILSTFAPFWSFYYHIVILPIANQKFDKAEYMALIMLLFFDPAYTNIIEPCRRICEDIRKVILQELRGYQTDKNDKDQRFLETVNTLLIIDKGERKFYEELLVCEMNNVRVHEEFRELIRSERI